jgi:hypothetical protein
MIDAKRKGNTAFLRKDKLVVNRKISDVDFEKENHTLKLSNRRLGTPAANEHISLQHEMHRQNTVINRQREGLSRMHAEEGQKNSTS